MEESQVGVDHRDSVLIARINDNLIVVRARRTSDVLRTRLISAINVVAEREERVRTYRHARQLLYPRHFVCLLPESRLIEVNQGYKWKHRAVTYLC